MAVEVSPILKIPSDKVLLQVLVHRQGQPLEEPKGLLQRLVQSSEIMLFRMLTSQTKVSVRLQHSLWPLKILMSAVFQDKQLGLVLSQVGPKDFKTINHRRPLEVMFHQEIKLWQAQLTIVLNRNRTL